MRPPPPSPNRDGLIKNVNVGREIKSKLSHAPWASSSNEWNFEADLVCPLSRYFWPSLGRTTEGASRKRLLFPHKQTVLERRACKVTHLWNLLPNADNVVLINEWNFYCVIAAAGFTMAHSSGPVGLIDPNRDRIAFLICCLLLFPTRKTIKSCSR